MCGTVGIVKKQKNLQIYTERKDIYQISNVGCTYTKLVTLDVFRQ